MQKHKLAEAKERLRIPQIWQLCGLSGEPRKSCRCPFHKDRYDSFSVFNDGLRWKCFAGCGGGDAVDFLQQARGLARADACREFIRLAGGGSATLPHLTPRRFDAPVIIRELHLGAVAPGNQTHWQSLASLRNVSFESVALAAQRGLLLFGDFRGHQAWFVTDCARRNAQARRLDGQLWPEIGNKKAWTLPGSHAGWPIGTKEAEKYSCVAFCEGGLDLLAAFHFIHCEARGRDCSAVAMLGASLDIHPDALPLFAGKRIRIFGHADASGAGDKAVERWAEQLTGAGAEVDAFNFSGLCKMDGSPVKDLNDCTLISADDFEANRELWGMLP